MWGLERVVSTLLLAASTPNTNIPFTTTTTTTTTTSVKDLRKDFRELYDILGERAPVYQQASPTIRFNFVTPPPLGQSWRDDATLYADRDLMVETTTTTSSSTTDTVFTKVASKYGGSNNNKPIALYLPGLDGFGVSAATWQFDDLSRTFELWRMSIKIEDRTSFGDLLNTVSDFVEQLAASPSSMDRPIYIIAESFGGLLAPSIALKLQKKYERQQGQDNNTSRSGSPIKGLVLVNPATSFEASNWDTLAPTLSLFGDLTDNIPMPFGLPSPYSIAGGLILSALIPSSEQNQRILNNLLADTISTALQAPTGAFDSMQGMMDSFRLTAEVLPPGLLKHRITNWMIVGSSLINSNSAAGGASRLSQLNVPTLVVVGTEDKLIASGNEVKRLIKTLPNCEKLEVKGAGHFVLDDAVNLTEAIVYSKLLDPLNYLYNTGNETRGKPFQQSYDPILDWKMPSRKVIEEIKEESVNFLDEVFSPIFISTDKAGNRGFGLQNLPKTNEDGPLLFVSNHQLLGLDLNLLINEFIEADMAVRGLAHPVVFQTPSTQRVELEGRTPGLNKRRAGGTGPSTSNFELFGAVMVTPRNFYRLLQTGQNALLFPGGVKEVFHGRDQAYELLWPEKVDFVRTAARFNATIIPLCAVGMADSLNIILDRDEIISLPVLGERARKFANNITAARFDMANEDELFLPPIVAPGLPSRNYFLFGKPISTAQLDPKDKKECETLYKAVQDEMRRGFEAVLSAREKDPYKDAPRRIAYEQVTGKKAPTFDLRELDVLQITQRYSITG